MHGKCIHLVVWGFNYIFMMYLYSQKNKGFTVVELLVSISIIGILSTIVFASFSQAQKKARITKRISDLKQMQVALGYYYAVNKSYPNTGGAWRSQCGWWGTLAANEVIKDVVNGNTLVPNYIASIPTDPKMDASANTSCYVYMSNGVDYFLMDYNVTEFTAADYLSRPELVDPFRDGVANTVVDGPAPGAWKVYTPGAAGW